MSTVKEDCKVIILGIFVTWTMCEMRLGIIPVHPVFSEICNPNLK